MIDTVEQHYAGFWRRLTAALLDLLLLASLLSPLLYLVYGPEYFAWRLGGPGWLGSFGVADALLTKALPLALLVALWSAMGATPGKLLMGCRVVSATDGSPITPRRALVRALCYLVSGLPLYLGFFWIGWDRRKQGFHDKIAGTVVVRHEDDYAVESLEALRARTL